MTRDRGTRYRRRRPHGASPAGVLPDRFRRRRRSLQWQYWRRVLVVSTLLALAGAAGWALLRSPMLGVRHVDVTGVGDVSVAKVTPAQVRAAGDLVPDTPLARIDLDALAARVQQLPGVASATAVRDWPHTVRVEVVERRPVATVEAGGSWRALDSTGVVFGDYESVPAGLPAVRTARGDSEQQASGLSEAAAVLDALEPTIAARLESVEVTSMDDITLVLRSGERVQWGSAAESDRKAQVLALLLRTPAARYDVTVPELPTTSQ